MRGLSARVDTKVFLINISPIAFDYLDSPATREDIENIKNIYPIYSNQKQGSSFKILEYL